MERDGLQAKVSEHYGSSSVHRRGRERVRMYVSVHVGSVGSKEMCVGAGEEERVVVLNLPLCIMASPTKHHHRVSSHLI